MALYRGSYGAHTGYLGPIPVWTLVVKLVRVCRGAYAHRCIYIYMHTHASVQLIDNFNRFVTVRVFLTPGYWSSFQQPSGGYRAT